MAQASSLSERLPSRLQVLTDLVMDLRWTWNHCGDALWGAIDAEAWARTRNPYRVLLGASRERYARLALDADFLRLLDGLVDSWRRYQATGTWWARQDSERPRGIVYFSMEFGLSEALPLYAGGLGVLAGDYLKAASDLGLPVTGIGLFYGRGYFRQQLDAQGQQHATYPANDPASLPIAPVAGPDGAALTVTLRLPGRDLRLRVWKAQVGRVALYLLDSNESWNTPADRAITGTLYGGDREQRLLQEIVLGVGGWRLVEALKLPAELCHLNEGHAALAAVERARAFQATNGFSFAEALWATRPGNIFTTHTAVAAAFDRFPGELVLKYGRAYAADAGLDESAVMDLGRVPGAFAESFNMAVLAARCCATINGVSRRHGEVSRRIFADLYPRWPLAQIPVGHVTNGVHMPSWDSADADLLWTEACGATRWLGDVRLHESQTAALEDEVLWSLRGREREKLVRFVRQRLARQFEQRDLGAAEVEDVRTALDPDVLTIGFARRFADYKRPNLLLGDAARLARLLLDQGRPVQLVVAGKAHPDDEAGQRHIREWVRFAGQAGLRKHVAFVEDYDLAVAEALVQGVDVWLNTPREPWEACGTSGMKVLVNGGLNLSVLDGWWAEAWAPDLGWAIPAGSDAQQGQYLLDILERELVPQFYERDAAGIPRGWVAKIRASLSRLTPRFSANRMLQEYLDRLYRPGAEELNARVDRDAQLAKDLCAWEKRLRRHWGGVRLGSAVLQQEASGGRPSLCVEVYLGELEPADVDVQLYADAGRGRPQSFCAPMVLARAIPGTHKGFVYGLALPCEPENAADFTPRVVPRHAHARLPQELELIRWP